MAGGALIWQPGNAILRRKGTSHIRVLRNLITTIGLDLLIFKDTVAAPVGEIPARAAFLHAIGGMPDEFRGEAS